MFLLGHSLSQSTTPRATTYITRKTYNRVRSTEIPGWWSRRKVLAEAQDNERLQVVFVSTEVAPWSKVGGLGDVISALPAALAARGHRVMTVSPRYVASPEEEDTGIVVPVQLGRATRTAAVAGDRCMVLGKDKEAHWVKYYWTHRDGVDHLFVDHPLYLQDGGGGSGGGGDGGMGSQRIYSYCHGHEYYDLPGRYSILCQAALAIPSIFWETALMTPERKDPRTHVQGGTQERHCPDTSAWHIVNGIAQKLSDMTSLTAKRARLQLIRPSCRAEGSLNTSHQEDGLHGTGVGMLRYHRSVTFVGNDWPCSLLPLWLQYYRMCHTAANSKLPGVAAQHEHQPASTAFPPVLTALEASSESELAYRSDDLPDDVDDIQEAPGPHDREMGGLDRHGSTDNLQETSTLAVDYLTDPDLTVSALLQEFAEYEAEAQRELDFMQQLHDHYHLLASFLEKRRQSGERQHPSVSEPRPSASFVVDDDQGDITRGAEVLQEGGGVNQQRTINQSDLITADQTDRLSLTTSTIAEDERSLDSPQGSELGGEYGGQPASVQGDIFGHPLGGVNCARLAINDTSQGGDVFMTMSGVKLTSMQEPPEVPADLDKSDDLLSSSLRDSDYIPPAAIPVRSRGGFLFEGGEDSGSKQALGVGGSHAKGRPPTEIGKHVSDPSTGFPEPLWTGTDDTRFDWVKGQVEDNKCVPYVRPDGPTYGAHDEAAVQADASPRGLSIVDSDSHPDTRGTELRRERKFDCSCLSSSRASCQLSRLQAELGRRLGDAHVAMAIHNMIYQGKFPVSEFSRTGLPLNFCPPFLNHTQVWAAGEVKTTELPLEQLLEAVGCHTLQKHKVPERMLDGRQALYNFSSSSGPTSWTSSVAGSPLLTEEQHNDSIGPTTAHQVAKLSPQEEDTSMVNWLKAALVTSDALVTVSQGYAQDLRGPCPLGLYDSSKVTGLETALEDDLSLVLSGRGLGSILNGLDTKAWDPQSDPYLPEGCRYDSDTVTQGKAAAKQFVQGLLGLEPDASVALVVFLGRLEPQKGADIVLAALPELLQATKEGGGVDLERPSGSPLLGGQDVTDRDTEDHDNADDASEKPSGTVAEAPHQDPLPASTARRIDIAEYTSKNPPCCEDAPLTLHLGLTSVVINKQKFPSGILSATPVHQGDHKEPTDVEEGKTGSGRSRQTARNPDVATAMTSGKCQVVMLGRGRAWLETRLSALAKRYPGTACGVAQFDEGLAHQLMAAADYLLVPSRSEPCGLVALSALRYGTIPIVTPVGGLRDIVDPGVGYLLPPVGSATNSLQFRDGVRGLVEGVRQALQDFDTPEFHRRRRVSMAMEVGWEHPAGQWEQLLSGLAHPPHLETG